MYKVEYIADKKIGELPNKQMYLVKWVGYDLSYASWQPLQNLSENCLDLVQQFENKYRHLKTTIIGKILPPRQRKKYEHPQNISTSQKLSGAIEGHKKIVKRRKLGKRTRVQRKSREDTQKKRDDQSDIQNSGAVLNVRKNQVPGLTAQAKKNGIEMRQAKPKVPTPHPLRKNSNTNDTALQINKINRADQQQPLRRISFCLPNTKQANEEQERQKKLSNTNTKDNNGKTVENVNICFTPIIIKDPAQYFHARKNSFAQRGKLSEENRQKKQSNRIVLKSLMGEKRMIEEKEPLDIIGMRKKGTQYQFYVIKNSRKIWMTHEYLFENYSKQLCKFYQKNMILQ